MACDRKVIVLVSDGQHRPALTSHDYQAMVNKASAFKSAGGIIICVGIRAAGVGFKLLQDIATPGFFLNVFGDTMVPVDAAIAKLIGLMGYYCAGTNPTGSITYDAQVPDDDPLPEVEFGVANTAAQVLISTEEV